MRAIGRYLIVEQSDAPVKTQSGLLVTAQDSAQIRYQEGKVLSVGTDVKHIHISAKKYERKLKSAIKSEAKGKRKKVTGTTTTRINRKPINTTTKKQTISKKNDKGRKKTFVATSTKKATAKDVAQAKRKRGDLMKIKTFHREEHIIQKPKTRNKGAAKAAGKQKK